MSASNSAIAEIKSFHILSDKFRYPKAGPGITFDIVAGIVALGAGFEPDQNRQDCISYLKLLPLQQFYSNWFAFSQRIGVSV